MGASSDGANGEHALCLHNLPDARGGGLKLPVLAGAQSLERLDADLEALAGSTVLPEAGHNPINQQDRNIPDSAARQHPLCPISRNQALAGMTSNEVAIEVRQQSHDILHRLPGCRYLVG